MWKKPWDKLLLHFHRDDKSFDKSEMCFIIFHLSGKIKSKFNKSKYSYVLKLVQNSLNIGEKQ